MRRAVHVGENAFNDRTKVVTHMMGDILRSAKRFMPALMENYKVLVYSGHLDIAVAYTATAQFVERIPWEVMIRDAGHLVPHDQPEAALDMLMRFIYDLPFADGEEIP
ncbi:hypothetical protein MRX96_034716 [Rhipicephalus microplus]